MTERIQPQPTFLGKEVVQRGNWYLVKLSPEQFNATKLAGRELANHGFGKFRIAIVNPDSGRYRIHTLNLTLLSRIVSKGLKEAKQQGDFSSDAYKVALETTVDLLVLEEISKSRRQTER